MSGPTWTTQARARIAAALADALADASLRQVAEQVGCSSSSVHRRGDDLSLWPAADLLALSAHHQGLRDALSGWLVDAPAPAASPARTQGELLTATRQAGELIADIACALSDGRIDATEARAIAARIRHRRQIEEQLLADLDAVGREGR